MKWNIAATNPKETAALASALGISPVAARVLAARGYADATAARRYLSPSATDLHDPFLLAGMDDAAARLALAVERKEPILLYGDYDVDGTSAIVLLKKTLEQAGGITSCFVPHRIRDGYGMKADAVEDAAANGVRLIVSVDTGIRANDVVRHAAGLGIDVIVTDHHLPEEELPPALAVLNPNRPDCGYPNKNLCGAAVALKLAEGLLHRIGWPAAKRERFIDSLLKLAAIATVADVVPLVGENRVIVKRGLEGLRDVRNPGLRALLAVAGIEEGAVPSARDVGFRIGPRINAAGRMASANDVIELFCTTDDARAKEIAAQLHELNADRQQTEAGIAQAIWEQCQQVPVTDADAALIFSGDGWHRGVVGIVASRVVERYHRPAIVLAVDPETTIAHGSGRSIAGFHLLEALETMPDLFTKFGGHKQAAGVTLPAGKIEEFRERFRAYAASRLTADDFEPVIDIDAEAELPEIARHAVADLLNLAPFGYGNAAPVLAVRGVELAADPEIKNEKHVFFRFRNQGRPFRAKAWSFVDRLPSLKIGDRVDVAMQIEEDAYSAARGYDPWQAIVKDIRPL
ncbi:MAG: single-stranded-DNA-specific exonuclease RecJ [Bryobacteraceae bacterium]